MPRYVAGWRQLGPGEGPELVCWPEFRLNGAAPESNRPSVGLPRRTGFEDFERNQLLAGEICAPRPCAPVCAPVLDSV